MHVSLPSFMRVLCMHLGKLSPKIVDTSDKRHRGVRKTINPTRSIVPWLILCPIGGAQRCVLAGDFKLNEELIDEGHLL